MSGAIFLVPNTSGGFVMTGNERAVWMGLVASALLAICALIFSAILLFILMAALYAVPTAWGSVKPLPFFAIVLGVACASAGLLYLATVPFHSFKYFRVAKDALFKGEVLPQVSERVFYGLVIVAVLFGASALLPILDGEAIRNPWYHVTFQMTLVGAPALLALVTLRAASKLKRSEEGAGK